MKNYTLTMEQTTTKEFLKRVSERIRTYRKSLGLTQEQLAEYSSLSHNYIAIRNAISNCASLQIMVSCLHETLNHNRTRSHYYGTTG